MFKKGDIVKVISYTEEYYTWHPSPIVHHKKRALIKKQGTILLTHTNPHWPERMRRNQYFVVNFPCRLSYADSNWTFHQDDLRLVSNYAQDWITEGF